MAKVVQAHIYRRKVVRLAEALRKPEERDVAAAAIRGLIERIVLTPGERRSELQITLRGDLATILEWTGKGAEKEKTDTPASGMSVSVVAGAGFEPSGYEIDRPQALAMVFPIRSAAASTSWSATCA